MIRNKIDADTHVDETEATWEYLTEAEKRFCPIPVDGKPHGFWLTDGRARERLGPWRSQERTGTTRDQRELVDIKARVQHMDGMGVEIQVIYPTVMRSVLSTKPEWQAALCRSYNRWMAEKTAEANGRLRWVVLVSPDSMEEALKELRFGKEHGAVGVFKRGLDCGGKNAGDPCFFPLYEEAQRLDLPICMHVGGSTLWPDHADPRFGDDHVLRPEIASFAHMAAKGVPDRFPTLRFGVIEAMASWVPYLIAFGKARAQFTGEPSTKQPDFFRSNRFYVTAQTSDDMPSLLQCADGAQDGLLVGTDYGHQDQSAVIGALSYVEELGEKEEIPAEAVRKILVDNPRTFYGL